MAKKSNKSEKPITKIGRFEMVNGVVTMLPPEDEEEAAPEAETEELVVEKSNGVVMVQSEFVEEDDLQYVIDESTEKQSRRLADQVREENDKRAAEAAQKLSPGKVGNAVVTSTESYKDIDLSVLDADIPVQNTSDKKKSKK